MAKLKKPQIYIVCILAICIALVAGLASANSPIPPGKNVNLVVANDDGVRDIFNIYENVTGLNNTYNFFNATQGPTQGLNALHITTDPINEPYGQVTNTNNTIGTFYFSDTGGRGWDDNGILMISVNGTPENLLYFTINILSSGYNWTPVDKDSHPTQGSLTYNAAAINETFTWDDFIGVNGYTSYWKPSTNTSYPLYDGQDVAQDEANENIFYSIFVDLYAGILGQGISYQDELNDSGAIKIQYDIDGLPSGSMVTFNAYAFCNSSNQGQGIRWTNAVNKPGNQTSATTSGYQVANYYDP